MKQIKETTREYKQRYYQKNKDKYTKRHFEYRNSHHGKIIQILTNINSRCYNPKTSSFKYYGAKGIENYLSYNDLDYLWERDKAGALKCPSIDRLYSDKDYTLENCQFIELVENCAKDKRKSVIQMTLDGKIVKEWDSMMEAEKIGKFSAGNISLCCLGKRKTHKGYMWEFNNETKIEKEEDDG